MTTLAHLRQPASGAPLTTIAALCKAAGDPLRAQILRVLTRDAYGVLELCQVFGVRQPALSHHLKILAGAGLVATRREGTCIFYRRAPRQDDGLDALRAFRGSSLSLWALGGQVSHYNIQANWYRLPLWPDPLE